MNVLVVVAMALAAISSLGVVLSRQTIYSALSLVVTIAMISVLFLLLNAQFLFAVQIIIYAGAVMVLFVFIIALLSPDAEDRPGRDWRAVVGLIAVAAVTILVFVAAGNGVTYNSKGFRATQLLGSCTSLNAGPCDPYRTFSYPVDATNAAGNVQTVAGQLFTTFLLPFEITSLLLLVAVIGAVYLTRRGVER
ncbi:MAG: NADH-quinone oxidoreductase subunit J [Candidatus Dormibacteraeota bacterium]|nr:NADH-quinone oxidoreductase subunit J [Candidatus Dormibacteraeota bacterium]MBV9525736.1 NADH-quinone oxidoreductase subunit J [Candidatus Dormibacteraeota bacterium]